MKQFVDNFNIDQSLIKKDVIQWKKKLKKLFNEKNLIPKWWIWLNIISFIFGVIGVIGAFGIGFALILAESEINDLGIVLIAVFTLIGIIGLAIFAFISYRIRKNNQKILIEELNGDGSRLYQKWFAESFQYESLSEEYKKMFNTSDADIGKIINKYRYKTLGSPVGVTKTYDIMGGIIFDNPFNLACGVFKSWVNNGKSSYAVYEYMPLLEVKTNYFQNCDIKIINSKVFPEYSKNQIKFENNDFFKNYSVITENKKEALMIFTPLVQEKWVKQIQETPNFKMHIKNGRIQILFQGFKANNLFSYGKTTTPFMNILDLYNSSVFLSIFFKKLEKNLINDLVIFSKIINLVFSISFFQWENLAQK